MVAQLHPSDLAARHGPQLRRAEGGVLGPPRLSGNAEHPLLVVELAHQLNDQVTLLRKGAVRAFQHVPAQLAARFLQGRNGAGRGQAAGSAALAHVPVAADLLQLVHPVVPVGDAVAAQHAGLQRHKGVAVQPPHHMHDVPAEVRQFFLAHPGRVAHHKAQFACQFHVLVHGVVHLVNGGLGVLHHVDVPKARRAVLFHEQRVKHKGVFPVVVKAPLGQGRVVLAGVQHHAVAVLAVVQHRRALRPGLFVIPVHHHTLAGGVELIVVDVLGHVQALSGVAFQLGVFRHQLLVVLQAQAEQVRALLNVAHARGPVQHQQVHALHADVAKAPSQRRVPEHTLHAGAGLELAPPGVAVHLLIVALLQNHRDDLRECLGRFFVVRRPGQNVGLRVVVHGVGVFVGNAVEQPPAGGLGLALHHLVFAVLPVSHAEPQLVVHNALVQRRLARLVFLQGLPRLCDLLRPDRLCRVPAVLRGAAARRLQARSGHRLRLLRSQAAQHPGPRRVFAHPLVRVSPQQLLQKFFSVHSVTPFLPIPSGEGVTPASHAFCSCACPDPAGRPAAPSLSGSAAG